MGKDVFIVKTALQLVNAWEARLYFDTPHDDASLIIVETEETDINIKQMSILLESQGWSDVHVVSYKPKYRGVSSARGLSSKLKRIVNIRCFTSELNRLASSFAYAERVFIGNYTNKYLLHLANRLKPKSVYLLDDGMLTLTINEMRKRAFAANSSKNGKPELKRRGRVVLSKAWGYLAGIDRTPPRKVTFFTNYDLAVCEADSVVVNHYQHLRSQIKELTPAKPVATVCFLGMPWEATFKHEDLYLDCVRRARDHFVESNTKSNFIYIPHRREGEETVRRVAKELNVTIETYSLPIECHMIMSKQLPKTVASFTSTGLVNCSLLFDGLIETVSFRIPVDYVKAERLALVQRAYEYYKREELGIKRIDFRKELVHT
jgi:hypothetical protein